MQVSSEHAHVEGSKRVFMFVWGWLLALTVVEVVLAYQRLEIKVMIALLMTLSIIKASLIISYFIHLRHERRSLALTLLPALVVVRAMLIVVFPACLRIAWRKAT